MTESMSFVIGVILVRLLNKKIIIEGERVGPLIAPKKRASIKKLFVTPICPDNSDKSDTITPFNSLSCQRLMMFSPTKLQNTLEQHNNK